MTFFCMLGTKREERYTYRWKEEIGNVKMTRKTERETNIETTNVAFMGEHQR